MQVEGIIRRKRSKCSNSAGFPNFLPIKIERFLQFFTIHFIYFEASCKFLQKTDSIYYLKSFKNTYFGPMSGGYRFLQFWPIKHSLNRHLCTASRSHICKESEETVEHFLGQCPATAHLRGICTLCNWLRGTSSERHALSIPSSSLLDTPTISETRKLGPVGGYLVLPMFRPLTIIGWPFSLQPSSGHRSPSTFPPYFRTYLSPGSGRASSSLYSCAPPVSDHSSKKMFWIIVLHSYEYRNQHCWVIIQELHILPWNDHQ